MCSVSMRYLSLAGFTSGCTFKWLPQAAYCALHETIANFTILLRFSSWEKPDLLPWWLSIDGMAKQLQAMPQCTLSLVSGGPSARNLETILEVEGSSFLVPGQCYLVTSSRTLSRDKSWSNLGGHGIGHIHLMAGDAITFPAGQLRPN